MANQDNNKNKLNLSINDTVASGTYSNLSVISHSPTEVTIDFAQVLPGTQNNAVVRQRIIMTPLHAKKLMMALTENISRYEEQFGYIEDPQGSGASDPIPYDMVLPKGKA